MQSARLKFLVGAALTFLLAAGCEREVLPGPPDNGAGGTGGRGGLPGGVGSGGNVSGTGGTGGIGGNGGVGGTAAVDARASAAEVMADTPALTTDVGADLNSDPAPLPDAAGDSPANPAGAVVWNLDNIQSIGGHRTMVLGGPMVIDTPEGKALQFDGQDDALFVDHHPLAGLGQFTVEIYFRPDSGGSQAQRWFHMQDDGSSAKVLFETRLFGASFVLDVFVESAAGEIALYAPQNRHPLGSWYHVAAVIDGQRARHYVNGVQEMDAPLAFRPHGNGRTSIAVRITRMYYFKGAIRLARFTPRALTPDQFLKPPAP
jgi:Concanavalin A-like lectin/glucanases superfamily